MMDQQLEDLDLVTFVLLNLEAEDEANKLELNNNQEPSKENTKSRRGRPCAKPPSREILSRRRNAANARERRRMNRMNEAFLRLKGMLPLSENIHSKKQTIDEALTYIKALAKALDIDIFDVEFTSHCFI